jgi:hypothetical protein
MSKIIHIRGKTKPRLCGAKGEFEPVGSNNILPICEECAAIFLTETGEVIE